MSVAVSLSSVACCRRERHKAFAVLVAAALCTVLLANYGQIGILKLSMTWFDNSCPNSRSDEWDTTGESQQLDVGDDWFSRPAAIKHELLHSSSEVEHGNWQAEDSEGTNSDSIAQLQEAERLRFIARMRIHASLQRRHRKARNPERVRAVIYSCTYGGFCGGLADRMNGVVVLYLLALVSNRSFFIDWTKPSSLEQWYRPREGHDGLDWQITSIAQPHIQNRLNAVGREYFQQRDDTADCDKLTAYVMDRDRPAVLRITTNQAKACVLRLLEREMKFKKAPPDAMGLVFRWLFQESAMLSEEIDSFVQETGWSAREGMCLHIRHGGKMGADKSEKSIIDPIRHVDIMPFWECAQYAVKDMHAGTSASAKRQHGRTAVELGRELSREGGPRSRPVLPASAMCVPRLRQWLVVSDDDALLDEAHHRLPSSMAVIDTRRLGPVLHVDKLGHYRKTQSLLSPVDGELRVFVDHALLRRCRTLLASHSSFSFSAAGSSTVNRRLYLVNWLRGADAHDPLPCRITSPYMYW